MGPFLLAPGVSTKTWREPPQRRAFRQAPIFQKEKDLNVKVNMTRYLSSDKNTRRYSRRSSSPPPPPPPPASSTPPTQHSSSPLSSSSKSSPSPQPSSETSSENRLSAKLEKQLTTGEDVEGTTFVEEEVSGLRGLPYIPDPDYATPYNPCPATPSPDYEEREKNPMERDLWGNARRYRGKQESATDPTRTLKEALKNRFAVHVCMKKKKKQRRKSLI